MSNNTFTFKCNFVYKFKKGGEEERERWHTYMRPVLPWVNDPMGVVKITNLFGFLIHKLIK